MWLVVKDQNTWKLREIDMAKEYINDITSYGPYSSKDEAQALCDKFNKVQS